MKNATLILILSMLNYSLGFGQSISGVSQKERDSTILMIKGKKAEETMPGLLYLYDQLDSSVHILKVYSAAGYDLFGFNYSKNLLDYIKFSPSHLIYLFNIDKLGKANILSSVEYYKLGIAIGPSTTWEQETYSSLLGLVNIYRASIFRIEGCRDLFVSIDRNVYIFVNGTLLEANSYLKSRYSVEELANLFNPRY